MATYLEPLPRGNSFGFTAWRGPSRTMAIPHAHNDIEVNLCDRPLVYSLGGRTSSLPAGVPCAFWGAKPHQLIDFEAGHTLAFATIPLAQFMSWSLSGVAKNRLLRGDVLVGVADAMTASLPTQFEQWSADLNSRQRLRVRAVELELEALLHRMSLGSWSLSTTGHTHTSLVFDQAGRMAAYISDNSPRDIRVADVARSVHLNPNRASAVFQNVFGASITRYLSQFRVAEAQRLLLTTTLSSASIGSRVGFQSSSSFHAVFRSICGTSPGQWKRTNEGGESLTSGVHEPDDTRDTYDVAEVEICDARIQPR